MNSGITMLILNKDDLEFVTAFPCLMGHPVFKVMARSNRGKLILSQPVIEFLIFRLYRVLKI